MTDQVLSDELAVGRPTSLPTVPKIGTPITADQVTRLESIVAERVAGISDIETLQEWRAQAAALESYLRSKGLQRPMLGAQRRVEARIGQLLPMQQGKRSDLQLPTHAEEVIERDGDRADFRLLSRGFDCLTEEEWRQSRRALISLLRQRLDIECGETARIDLPTDTYRTIVIDPPWPMARIDRALIPQLDGVDYPVMTHEQIADMDVGALAANDGCHLFCWTTQKHLPASLQIVEDWGFSYSFLMVWHKPGGFQPFGYPQYNCEFVVYARKNSPQFVDTKQFFTCFEAPRREHSRKPDEFYDLVRRVTDGARIDIFSREPRDGFVQFGNEVERFAA